MKLPISVWLSAIVLFAWSGYTAWQQPVAFFESLCFTVVIASFARIFHWFMQEKE